MHVSSINHMTCLLLSHDLSIVITWPVHCYHMTYIIGFSTAQPLDSARANLASSFVNGFVNCAFGQDQLVMEDGSKWLYKHKSYG